MAGTGQTGMGFPKEYGGGGDVGASSRRSRRSRSATCRCWSRPACSSGCSAARSSSSARSAHHDAYLADLMTFEPAGLLRDDRDRARLQRAGARHHRDVRPGDARVRDHHARPGRAQGLHRQRRPARRMAVVFAQLDRRGEEPRRARVRRADPRRRRRAAARRTHRGRRPQDGPQRRRQRPDLVRPRAGAARRAAQPVRRRRPPTAPTPARSRTRTAASSRCSARWCRAGSASAAPASAPARSRWPSPSATATAAASSATPATRRSCSSTTGAPAPAASRCWRDLRAALRAGGARRRQLHDVFSGRTRRADERPPSASSSRGRRLKALGTWHATRTIQECREACGGAGYLSENRFPRSRPTPTSSRRSRATTRPAAAGRQGPADRLLRASSRTWTSSAWSGSWPTRRSSGDRADHGAQAARAGQGRAARRRRPVGPGGRPARPDVPARDAALPRGAHARGVAKRLKRGIDSRA
jgi:acyl-CoA oxidase